MKELIEIPRIFTKEEREREERIHSDIIVDAYGDIEIVSSWRMVLGENLGFPFLAEVQTHHFIGMNRKKNSSRYYVQLLGMAPPERCGTHQMWCMGVLPGNEHIHLHFYLTDIRAVEADEVREEMLSDWMYWCRDHRSESWFF